MGALVRLRPCHCRPRKVAGGPGLPSKRMKATSTGTFAIFLAAAMATGASGMFQGPVPQVRAISGFLPDLSTVVLLIRIACSVFLALVPFTRKWARKYKVVITYVFVRIGCDILARWSLLTFGVRSIKYTYVYVFCSTILILCALAVVLDIYRVLGAFSFKGDWYLPAGSLCIMLVGFFDQRPIWPLYRMLDILYSILTFVGGATLLRMIVRRKRVNLGWNLKLVLLALTIPASFFSLVFVTFTMGMGLSHQTASFWTQGAALASWIILVAAMYDHSPPRQRLRPTADAGGNLPGDTVGTA